MRSGFSEAEKFTSDAPVGFSEKKPLGLLVMSKEGEKSRKILQMENSGDTVALVKLSLDAEDPQQIHVLYGLKLIKLGVSFYK